MTEPEIEHRMDPMMKGRPFFDRIDAAVRHYAAERQCFVINATGFIDEAIRAAAFDLPDAAAELAAEGALNGASSIVAPDGRLLAGPLSGREGIVSAEIDRGAIAYAKYWFDAAGHSNRSDIVKLKSTTRSAPPYLNRSRLCRMHR